MDFQIEWRIKRETKQICDNQSIFNALNIPYSIHGNWAHTDTYRNNPILLVVVAWSSFISKEKLKQKKNKKKAKQKKKLYKMRAKWKHNKYKRTSYRQNHDRKAKNAWIEKETRAIHIT